MSTKTLLIREKTIFDGIFSKYILKFLFSLWFKIAGWKLCKVTPEGAGITIAAPHTSNWDFIYALGAAHGWQSKLCHRIVKFSLV